MALDLLVFDFGDGYAQHESIDVMISPQDLANGTRLWTK